MPASRTPLWVLAAALVPAGLVVLASVLQTRFPLDNLYKDVASGADLILDRGQHTGTFPAHLGAISNLGVVLWCFTAGVCAAGAGVLRARSREATCLGAAAALTLVFGVDDLSLFHERIAARALGVDENWIFACYGLALAAYLVSFRQTLLGLDWIVLAAALVGFGISIFLDVLPVDLGWVGRVGEDGAKLVGISAWTTFHLRAVWLLTTDANPGGPSPGSQPAF